MAGLKRKGVIFTLVSILIVTVLVLSFSSQSYVTLKDRVPVINSRFNIANNYVIDLKDSYLERALYANSVRSLFAIVIYVNNTDYLADDEQLNTVFKEILINGTINGENVDSVLGMDVLHGRNFTERLLSIENASYNLLRINTTFDKNYDGMGVTIFQSNQTGPFRVGVNLTINFTVDAGIFVWNSTDVITTTFSLQGFEDPLYFMNTPGREISNRVFESNFTNWNATNLYYHIANNTYKSEPSAPSYLSRLYNDFTASECCGIESAVNPRRLGISADEPKTFIDWCFWGGSCGPGDGSAIWYIDDVSSGSPYGPDFTFFKLDTYHISPSRYNVTDEALCFGAQCLG